MSFRRGIRIRCALVSAAAASVLASSASRVEAQNADADDWMAPRWVGDVTFLSANALLAGLTAGIVHKLEGGEFRDGFARGALGGAVAYAGRRISAEEFWGAGLLARQVSAVGISIARNAADGRPSFERLMFPVGPVHVYVDRSDGTSVQPKLVLNDFAWLVSLALRSETRFDWSASLSAGAPVLRSPGNRVTVDGERVGGVMAGGTILLSDLPEEDARVALPHERVHVLQHDFAFLLWSDPIEERLLRISGFTQAIYRYVDVGITFSSLAALGLTSMGLDPGDRPPWEVEAHFLTDPRP